MILNFLNKDSEYSPYTQEWERRAFQNIVFDTCAPHILNRYNQDSEYAMPLVYNYEINSAGFRGKEFTYSPHIIALGCSHTFGVGLPIEFTWPNVVSRLTGIDDVVNLGRSGSSIAYQVRCLINYIRIYGQPKIVLATFPNLTRYEYCDDRGRITYGSTEKGFDDCSWSNSQALSQSIDAINTLEAICRTNSICLRWQIWASTSEYVENRFAEFFDNRIPNKYELQFLTVINPRVEEHSGEIIGEFEDQDFGLSCCVDLRDDSRGCFNYAFDRYVVPKRYRDKDDIDSEILSRLKATTLDISHGSVNAHFGSHAHYHWAKNLVDSI